ncbi:hypothetical protein CCR75_006904 [Bremia lactucae]|uniref:Major facilitator superfamily (MFS) profile domain-containing protein n=1 Tax=Bremia lactucae TaxID=4779 RepID=A0A976NXM8_BRELC|nr:hypothetical protein CCR75_006904 [Bremia lactucae]
MQQFIIGLEVMVESPNKEQSSLAVLSSTSIDDRLNQLEPRLSWFYVRLLLLTGGSWAIQAAELVLLIFTRGLVAHDIGMGTPLLQLLGVSLFIGSIVGGPFFGHVADRFGRRMALIVSMIFSLGGLTMTARADNKPMLLIARAVIGFGFGGQLTSTFLLVYELSPRSMSGRMVSLLDAFTGIGGLIGMMLAFALALQSGWRATYLMTSGLVMYTIVLYFTLFESPRWLAEVGRTEEAHMAVRQIEQMHGFRSSGDISPKTERQSSYSKDSRLSMAMPSRLKRVTPTLVLWTLWIATTMSSYAMEIFVPTLISLTGYNVFTSWITIGALKVAQVAGSVAAAISLDAYGSHRSFAVFAPLASSLSILLSYATWSRAIVVFVLFMVTALLSACWSCVYTYTPQDYNICYRGRGIGYAVGSSRLAAVVGCYLYPHMFNVWKLSVPVLCWIFGGVLAIAALLIAIVPHFGYQPLAQGDDINLYTLTSVADLENDMFNVSKELVSVDNEMM